MTFRLPEGRPRRQSAFTLVELLVAISITLLIMATVVAVFTNVSDSVQKRRAMVEVSNQLRQVRNQLQSDLKGATCPTIPWIRPESDQGYFEIIEGPYSDFNPSLLTDFDGTSSDPANPEINHATSTIPTSNVDYSGDSSKSGWVTDGRGLGDHDDILAFTSRNEANPFRGRAPNLNVDPSNGDPVPYAGWDVQSIESPVAEIIWYAVEAPIDDSRFPAVDTVSRFGEAGYRTIYRRVLLVAPWLDYSYRVSGVQKSRPSVLRILPGNVPIDRVDQALAALISFQERYDISARVEWDPTLDGGRWTIVANTLADLTKRENRYEHHGIVAGSGRVHPFPMVSGGGADAPGSVTFVADPEYGAANAGGAQARPFATNNSVYNFNVENPGSGTIVRPLVMLQGGATARAILNEQGRVVHVTSGLSPLGVISARESRLGQDIMLTQALAFDVQVFDPHAPVYALLPNGQPLTEPDVQGLGLQATAAIDATMVAPGDAGWSIGVARNGSPVSTGAYVDLGYVYRHQRYLDTFFNSSFSLPTNPTHPLLRSPFAGRMHPRAQLPEMPATGFNSDLEATLFRTWCSWSYHYETNGIDEDRDGLIDEGTNGLDDESVYDLNGDGIFDAANETRRILGVDDPGERETAPPYAAPLRGIQVRLRVYETDSRQMREVTVRQHFVPE